MEQTPSAPEPALALPKINLFLFWLRISVCWSLILSGVGVILFLGSPLYREVNALMTELRVARDREPIGYVGISAEHPEFKPRSCVREGNGGLYLWAGSGVKGQAGWFDVSETEWPVRKFAYAFGRDRVKAIDYPIVQELDGDIARRIYPERPVLGLVMDGIIRAYPLTVMEKVEVVNDTIVDWPVAVTYCPLIAKPAVYDRRLDGETLSMGSSGYCYEGSFVLYDRGTDSLWYPQPEGLTAIAGPLAGKVLPLMKDQLERMSWGQWQRRHPQTRVVVGGDRSRGIPLPASMGVAASEL